MESDSSKQPTTTTKTKSNKVKSMLFGFAKEEVSNITKKASPKPTPAEPKTQFETPKTVNITKKNNENNSGEKKAPKQPEPLPNHTPGQYNRGHNVAPGGTPVMMTPLYDGSSSRNLEQVPSNIYEGGNTPGYFETPGTHMRNMVGFSNDFQLRKSPLMQSPGPNYRFNRYNMGTPQMYFDNRANQYQNKEFPQSPLLQYMPNRDGNIKQINQQQQNEGNSMFNKRNE